MASYTDVIELNNEKKIVFWDSEAQSIVAVPFTTELLQELQPTAKINAKDNFECATTSTNNVNIPETINKSEDFQAASWKDEFAVKKLINLWKTNESLFKNSKIRNEIVWRQIAVELQKTNPNWTYTGIQCENKFKDIRKNYVKVKDHNANSTGGTRKTSKFYEDMEEVLGDKPCIKPVATASTLRKRSSSSSSNSTCAFVSEEDEIQETTLIPRKRNRITKSLEEWAISMKEDSMQREIERERRHKEKFEKQEQAITTYREFMSKLLDKL